MVNGVLTDHDLHVLRNEEEAVKLPYSGVTEAWI